jgi:hypothetical protein
MAYRINEKPKKKFSGYISKYASYKKILHLKKTKSIFEVLFCTQDLEDEWLIDVIRFKPKTGEIIEDFMITKKDFDHHKDTYLGEGFLSI